jgi:UrcA family protein
LPSRAITALAAASAVLSFGGGALAQSPEYSAAMQVYHEPEAAPVPYADLDLASHNGAAAMLDRLHRAAMDVCGAPTFSLRDYRWAVGRSGCVRASMDRAVAELGAPTVSQLYQARLAGWG